ncbi:TauD/TfdA family dioxygenase [Amycolatopsis sp. 195334CR]|uniref:TauD/TfdA family dioxygenase n=1 Tax=Amycolatopsis sp. 195334CR TaxID=2814588 RepID=UPI001A8F5956|nr:TauD/TfdA family dioxygenase [Amycolatopsis sp. 195334CR]MBN6034191.1 TauD/TfdA family dioxygenase [Amycolatopsis sp. 195334CR]
MRTMLKNSSATQARAVLNLSPAERQVLLDLARTVRTDPATHPEKFCADARVTAARLPARVGRALHEFARWGSSTGYLLLTGLPIGPTPSTPADNTHHLGERTLLARAQALIGEALGHLIGYEAEGFGRLFQDMVPAREAAATQTSLSSLTELELHTEQAFSELRPDYISLACLRGDPQAQTYTFTARQISVLATGADLHELRRTRWMTGVDESFRVGGHEFDAGDVRGPMPILYGAADDPYITLDQDLMISTTPAAKAAFADVLALYQTHRHYYSLKPGDLLLIDNNRTVHGRSPFRPRFDGSDRFVIRTFITNDLARSRYARAGNGRIIAARYS